MGEHVFVTTLSYNCCLFLWKLYLLFCNVGEESIDNGFILLAWRVEEEAGSTTRRETS